MLLFSCSVISNSLQAHGACQASLSFTISWSLSIESVMPSNHLVLCCPLLLLPPIFPSIRVFSNESALLINDQSIVDSVSASVLPMNIQDWFPLVLTSLISFQSKGLSRVFSNTTVQKRQFLVLSLIYGLILTSVYDHWKNHTMIMQNFVGKVMPLLLNTLSRFFIVFISRSMCLLISWLQSPSAVILEPNM